MALCYPQKQCYQEVSQCIKIDHYSVGLSSLQQNRSISSFNLIRMNDNKYWMQTIMSKTKRHQIQF